MSITFLGNDIPQTARIITGFHSLDKALGDKSRGTLGFPIKTLVEIYGQAGIGKTTFMMSLAGIFASQLSGKIAFADLEGQSEDTISNALEMNGFAGELDFLKDAKTVTHSNILDNMIREFRTSECNVALLDSMGAFMPPGEQEGSVDDANMGQKPRIMGNWTRKMVDILNRPILKVCLYVSHQHSNIGFVGTHTSGGETKKFLNAVQLELKKKDDYETGWLLEGRIKKNRYGRTGPYFYVFCIGGQGVHGGMSSVFDCVSAGMAEIERNTVRMGGQSFGKVARMIETWQDADQFAPFMNALKAKDAGEDVPEVVDAEPKKKGRKKK